MSASQSHSRRVVSENEASAAASAAIKAMRAKRAAGGKRRGVSMAADGRAVDPEEVAALAAERRARSESASL